MKNYINLSKRGSPTWWLRLIVWGLNVIVFGFALVFVKFTLLPLIAHALWFLVSLYFVVSLLDLPKEES